MTLELIYLLLMFALPVAGIVGLRLAWCAKNTPEDIWQAGYSATRRYWREQGWIR